MSSNLQNNDSPFSANGRFGRLSYLGWNGLILIIIAIFLIIVTLLIPNSNPGEFFSPIILILFLFVYIPLIYLTFVFTIRRLHDFNVSGWASILLLIPFLNIILGISLVFVGGNDGENQYGSPHITQTWEKVLGWIYLILFPLGILVAIALPAYQDYVERAQLLQMEQQIKKPSE